MHHAQGAYAEALTHHQRALDLLASELAQDSSVAVVPLYDAARAAMAAGRRDLADAWTEHGLRICDQSPNPVNEGALRFVKALGLAMDGKEGQARRQAEAALELVDGGDEFLTREIEAWLASGGPRGAP